MVLSPRINFMSVTVAIVGRPNVGKSTLFNRIVGRRLALVNDLPGLTRDRKEAETRIGKADVRLIDTAGLEEAHADAIETRMKQQTQTAIEDADIILFVIDARAGVTPADEVFADLVRSANKPVIMLTNKCEGKAGEPGYYEAFRLGLGEPVALSAEHGEGIGELYSAIEDKSADIDQDFDQEEDDENKPLRVAIVGRPNAGKSTLINALIGEQRMITGPEAGLTRDSISVPFEWNDRAIKLFDTAGLRKKARVKGTAEKLSVHDALRAIRFAEVVVLLLDATHPLEKQDLTIADMVASEGRALVIGINKWDLIEDKQAYLHELHLEIDRLLPQIKGIPVITMSAIREKGLDKLMRGVFQIEEIWNKRLPTGALNRFLDEAVAKHTPPAVGGKRIRLRYMTQPNARPPTFVVFCSRPEDLPTAYSRYLMNGIRETFDMPGVPIRLHMRKGKNPYANKKS